MTNPIDRRIARIEEHYEPRREPPKRRILFLDNPHDAEQCQQQNPEVLVVTWLKD